MTSPSAGLFISSRPWLRPALVVLGALVAFAAHFRPWEVAFLEEWPLAEFWMERGGFAFAANYFEWSLSRPLHLAPTGLGLALSGGTPFGIWVVLGLVAAGQFLAVVWALRSVGRSFWVTGAVALMISLHPFWPGGYLQRFLPAQTAALALFLAAGLLIRYLQQGRVRWIVWAGVAIILGLCVYPGIAVASPLMALVVALAVPSSWKRRIIGTVTITVSAAIVMLYSLVIARMIVPGGATYESGNFAPATVGGPREFVMHVGTVLVGPGFVVLGGIIFIALLGGALALAGAIPQWAGWLITGTAAVSPACVLVFFANILWLQDVERVAYATSLGLAIALLVWPLTSLGQRVRLEAVIAIVLVAITLVGAVRGIHRWQPYIALQHQLFSELAPVVKEAEGDEIVVVVDHSGMFGSEYTLPQHYMSSASHVMNGDPTRVWLCYLPTDPPLAGAVPCNDADTGKDLRLVSSFTVPQGDVDIYIGTPPAAK
ncbi:hypothetical protein [Microbacterium hydrocarbonoxydans]|uniref:hypothetical protein n=1 Tax=Microbacterium hydrocarbonoxydans TaxID=273678 RepID=UPI003D98270D